MSRNGRVAIVKENSYAAKVRGGSGTASLSIMKLSQSLSPSLSLVRVGAVGGGSQVPEGGLEVQGARFQKECLKCKVVSAK